MRQNDAELCNVSTWPIPNHLGYDKITAALSVNCQLTAEITWLLDLEVRGIQVFAVGYTLETYWLKLPYCACGGRKKIAYHWQTTHPDQKECVYVNRKVIFTTHIRLKSSDHGFTERGNVLWSKVVNGSIFSEGCAKDADDEKKGQNKLASAFCVE